MRLNIVKTNFFIFLKGYKSSSTFINFCYSSHKNDFYIPILTKPLKIGPNKSNVLEGVTSKSSLYRSKDRQQFEILKRINTGNNGFKDLSF